MASSRCTAGGRDPHVDALGVQVEPGQRHVFSQQVSPPTRAAPVSMAGRVEPSPMPHTVRSDPVGTSLRCRPDSYTPGEKYSTVLWIVPPCCSRSSTPTISHTWC